MKRGRSQGQSQRRMQAHRLRQRTGHCTCGRAQRIVVPLGLVVIGSMIGHGHPQVGADLVTFVELQTADVA